MSWHDVWPQQRANVTRKRLSKKDEEYRVRVRNNKRKARSQARKRQAAADRAARAEQRKANQKLIGSRPERKAKRKAPDLRNLEIVAALIYKPR